MKKIFLLAAVVAVLAGCLQRGASSSAPPPQDASSSSQSSSADLQSSKPEEPEAPKEPERKMREQPDPTLEENQKASFYVWHNDEFLKFGKPESYVEFTHEIVETTMNTNETAKINIKLPACIVPEGGDVSIDFGYDGGFANGNMPIGGTTLIILKPSETIDKNEMFPMESFAMNIFTGEKYNVHESAENEVGAYVKRDKYNRYVTAGWGHMDNNDLKYVCKPDDSNKMLFISFNVGNEATAEDLKLYDAIVESITLG